MDMYLSELDYQNQNWLSARNRLLAGVKRETLKPQRTARVKMEALIEAQLNKIDIVPRGRKSMWLKAIEEAGDNPDRIAELEHVSKEWKDEVKAIILGANENMVRVKSADRDDHIVNVRRAITKVLRARGWSTPRIGRFMNRDHTSILNYLNPLKLRKQSTAKALANGEDTVID